MQSLPHRVWDIGDINHCSWSQPVSGINLEIVSVAPFSSCTVSIVGVVLGWEVLSCNPVEIRETDHI